MVHQQPIMFDSTPVALDKFFLKLKSAFELLQFDYDDLSTGIVSINLFDSDTIFLSVKNYSDADIFVSDGKPVAKAHGSEFRDLRPNDNWKSTAFLYEHSPREYTKMQTMVKLDLSFVVSYQQKLLIPFLASQMAEKLQLICVEVINNTQIGGKGIALFTNRDTVFSDFDIKYFTPIFTNNFNHFRIRFSVEIPNDCTNGNVTFIKDANQCH